MSTMSYQESCDSFCRDNLVYQTLELIGASVPAPACTDNNYDYPYSDFFQNLTTTSGPPNEELEQVRYELKCALEKNRESKEKTSELVKYITYLHQQFGSLLNCITSVSESGSASNGIPENYLCFGPFRSQTVLNELMEVMSALSNKLISKPNALDETTQSIQKVNSLLKKAALHKKIAKSLNKPSVLKQLLKEPTSSINCSLPVPTTEKVTTHVGNSGFSGRTATFENFPSTFGDPTDKIASRKTKSTGNIQRAKTLNWNQLRINFVQQQQKVPMVNSNSIRKQISLNKLQCKYCKETFSSEEIFTNHYIRSHKSNKPGSPELSRLESNQGTEPGVRSVIVENVNISHIK